MFPRYIGSIQSCKSCRTAAPRVSPLFFILSGSQESYLPSSSRKDADAEDADEQDAEPKGRKDAPREAEPREDPTPQVLGLLQD